MSSDGPYGGHDPQTPPGAEAALQSFSDALEPARQARDAARRGWLLSDECPKAGVFDGVRVTVAERDAWVEDRIAGEERTFRLAREKRKAAAKALDILGRQASYQQTISKSVGDSYRGTGGDRW